MTTFNIELAGNKRRFTADCREGDSDSVGRRAKLKALVDDLTALKSTDPSFLLCVLTTTAIVYADC